ncbi:MAG: Gfo/Idh/MocA family protein [Vicinamibacterales bacterium]
MTCVRWGILGTARINRRLIPAMRAAARSELVAIASRDQARANAHARDWAIPKALASYHALVEDDDVEAVYIPLPNSEHVRWTLAAVAAGKHVLCEKPLALDPADVDRIADAATAQGVVVEEGFMYAHEPLTERVQSLVANGAVGAVRAVVSGFTFVLDREGDVRLDPTLGGGSLWDVGGYPLTYAQRVIARPPVKAVARAQWAPAGVDEEFAGIIEFSGGATANIYSGFRAPYRTWLEIVGTEGALRVPNPFKPALIETLELERTSGIQQIDVAGSPLLFQREIEDFIASVLDHAPQVVSLAESRTTAATLAALYSSARHGRAVAV